MNTHFVAGLFVGRNATVHRQPVQDGEKACYNNAMIYEMRRDEIPATGAGKRGLRKEGR